MSDLSINENPNHGNQNANNIGEKSRFNKQGTDRRFAAVPNDLKSINRWVTWRDADGKKIPNQRIDRPDQFLTYQQAVERVPADGGIGFVFTNDDDLGGVDLDGCRDPVTGKAADWVHKWLILFNSYAEVSPSGTGFKIFAHGCPKSLRTNSRKMEGDPIPIPGSDKTKSPGIEAYVSGRFFAVTGQAVSDVDEVGSSPKAWNELAKYLDEPSKSSARVKAAGRNDALFKVGCSMRSYGMPESAIRAALQEANRKNSDVHASFAEGPLDDGELNGIVERVLKYEAGSAGRSATPDWVDRINDRFACVVDAEGSGFRIVEDRYDGALKKRRYVKHKLDDLIKAHAHEKVVVNPTKNPPAGTPIFKAWNEHPGKQLYETMGFYPGGAPNWCLNTWRGFGIDPCPGDHHLRYLDHLREIICAGNEEHFHYLERWLAHMVQHPDHMPGVAVVMRGPEGAGKGMAVAPLGRIMGDHFMHLTEPEHLVGRFTGHLNACVLCFADEALYAGNKKHEAVLKGLITEAEVLSEGKYQPAKMVRRYVHLMMASNSEWVVPANINARRFFVLDVSDIKRNDFDYFGAMDQGMRGGGDANLLNHLLNVDLSAFNVRRVPRTDALRAQQALTLDPKVAWLMDLLDVGELPCATDWPDRVCLSKDAQYGGKRYPGLFDEARRSNPQLKSVSDQMLAKLIKKIGAEKVHPRPTLPPLGQRNAWLMPSLVEARSAFCDRFLEVEFDDTLTDWNLGVDGETGPSTPF